MPIPASEAIASDVGHGALGVRYGLRPFRDLLSETVGQRHLWLEMRPKKMLATWTSEGSGVYSKAIAETFDGVTLDIIGVKTLTETLTRVESQARCSTAGTFYYSGTNLYIHLTADANPSGTTVVAELGVHLGSHGVHQPVLLPDRLTNGSLDAWTGTVPDGWLHNEGGGTSLDKTSSDPLQGSYAARFSFPGGVGQGSGDLYQEFTTLFAGALYRVSGAYRIICPTNTVSLLLYIRDTITSYLLPDGRTTSGAAAFVFTDSIGDGEWRRFSFDFICPSWDTVRVLLRATPTDETGTADLDDLKLQCISRFAYHEPLLSIDSLPTIDAARADAFWGEQSSGIGKLSLANAGGRFEVLLATYDWLGAEAIFRVGGRYQLGANEILMDDCPVIATAKLWAPSLADSRVTFELEDDRSTLLRTLPTRTYNNNGVDAYQQPDRGRVRPLLFGKKTGIRPVQYDIAYYSGGPVPLGKYELADVTDWSNGLVELTVLYWYEDEQAALGRDQSRRTSIVMASDYSSYVTLDLPNGRFTVLRDMRPLVITPENNKLHFDIGGATLLATVATGVYPLDDNLAVSGRVGLLKTLQDAMNTAAGVSNISCTFTDSTQKVQISRASGTLSLRCATGADMQMGIWAILGFDVTADRTGSLTYDADAVFTSGAASQVIRADCWGFKDTSGTYTGVADDIIQYPAEVAWFLLREVLKMPASAIDAASFVTVRTAERTAPFRPGTLYIGGPRAVTDVFAELEATGNFDLVVQAGKWYCLLRDDSIPSGTPDLVDADFLAFESSYDPEDLFGTVTLTYNESPDHPEPMRGGYPWAPGMYTSMGEVTDATIALRHGRPHQKLFKTCLRDTDDAAYPLAGSRLDEISGECWTKRRRFRFTAKGKVLQIPVNGKIRLTRTRGLDTTGALSNLLVRVLRKRDDWARWVSEVEAIEVLPT